MHKLLLLVILPFYLVSCTTMHDHGGKIPLVEVDGSFLYREDLNGALPSGLSKKDSLLFAEHYIRNWVDERLLYSKAKDNIPDNAEIDKLVKSYRKSLILHIYQEKLINQKLVKEVPDEEIQNYYEANKDIFVLDHGLIKGLFIKVPLTGSQLNKVRKYYKMETEEAVEFLEKYSLRGAVSYEYFYDKWISVSDILDRIPIKVSDPEKYLLKRKQIEFKDSAFYYFLNVTDYRKPGEQEPYELAKEEAKDMLVNMKRTDFLKKMKDDLYQQAVSKNRIINY